MRSTRFSTKEGGRNAVVDSLFKQGEREERKKDFKRRYGGTKGEKAKLISEIDKFDFDTADDLAGVQTLILGGADGKPLEGNKLKPTEIQIGDRFHKITDGKIRVISDDLLEAEMQPILDKLKYDQALVSMMMADPSDKIAFMLLGPTAFNSLSPDARPSKLANTHRRSEEFSKGASELMAKVRETSIIVDNERIMKYLDQAVLGGKTNDIL